MSKNPFSVKDHVNLSSGGPKMTIEKIDGAICTCVWFVDGQKQLDDFHFDLLDDWGDGIFLATTD